MKKIAPFGFALRDWVLSPIGLIVGLIVLAAMVIFVPWYWYVIAFNTVMITPVVWVMVVIPLGVVFWIIRVIYLFCSGGNERNAVRAASSVVFLIIGGLIVMWVGGSYQSAHNKYTDPCSYSGPTKNIQIPESYERAITLRAERRKEIETQRIDEMSIALHWWQTQSKKHDLEMSDLELAEILEKDRKKQSKLLQARLDITVEAERVFFNTYLEMIDDIETKYGQMQAKADRQFRAECEAAFPYAYQPDTPPTLSVGEWVRIIVGISG